MNIMKPSMQTSELMSALADGQLGREDIAAALQACQHDESAFASWNTYHLIGDVLRSPGRAPAPVARGADLTFVSRLNQRLAQEPRVGTQPRSVELDAAGPATRTPARNAIHHRGPASNDGSFRWKLVAGFASIAAVSAIAWNASGLLAPAPAPQLAQAPAPQLAQAPAPQVVVASPQGPMVRDARLEELLAAHRQLGGTAALQAPSGFLRNATFEAPPNAGR